MKKKRTRFYYKARLNNELHFIKVGKNDSAIKNEILINKYLTRCGVKFVPQYLMSDENFDKDTSMLVMQFLPDIHKFILPKDEKALESICEEFISILNCFRKFEVIHGDICVSNLLLNSDGNIILTDFGVGVSPESDISQVDLAVNCGTYFILSGNIRTYDDAFSFLRMLDDCGISDAFKQRECYQRIEQLVGVLTHSITI